MEKHRKHTRVIKFLSEKNGIVVKVLTQYARKYADVIESMPNVKSYETLKILDKDRYNFINTVDIRKEYFDADWQTDFVLYYNDGSIGIRELVLYDYLYKRSTIEQLEMSRRYWMSTDIRDWKVVVIKGEK